MSSDSTAEQLCTDYHRIETAIRHIAAHVPDQPGLSDLARLAGVSEGHMQRTFQRWAGVSPKRFLQYLTLEHAKLALRQDRSVFDSALEAGLSGPSRLHDHFVSIEAVTPGEYRALGDGLSIHTGVHPSPFGNMFIAATSRGICALHFLDDDDDEASRLRVRDEWPGALISRDPGRTGPWADMVFNPADRKQPLNLLVSGTNFQVRVWRALLDLPPGGLTTYGAIAGAIGSPSASRAVGTAVGSNRISWLIPCHRVIRASGVSGKYHWGAERKRLMNAWEAGRKEAALPL